MKVDTFARGRVELIKINIPEDSRLAGLRLTDMESKLHGTVLQKLPAVKRIWSNDLFLVSRPRA